ncbi:hypothetical protein HIM_04427 [Hirsutella minnesotensis 3608]|uniref:Uncharacterized protein n=1 Tax=Hirsutella minnesotensis 3608 TaxID=1043627 RepID=A0A0F7ZPZ2_9HYPO|nr:hypothetical protein HIM_04427 [Hirsutella minnesotensis 3608]
MLSVPYWLTDCSIDDITDERYDPFDQVRQTFLKAIDEEGGHMQMKHDVQVTAMMQQSWVSKGVWFWACVRSVNAWLFVCEDHILPKFSPDTDLVGKLKELSSFWKQDAAATVKAKVEDEQRYQAHLSSLFHNKALPHASKEERNSAST